MSSPLHLGSAATLDGAPSQARFTVPTDHLVTHGVVLGMTGSGKTGLVTVVVEEALSAGVPTIVLDIKGDLPNLLLCFPSLDGAHFAPWLDDPSDENVRRFVGERRTRLAAWDLTEARLGAFCAGTTMRVLTPGSRAGECLHVLSSIERRSPMWDPSDPRFDLESARSSLSAAVSLLLGLVGRDNDPARSKEHVLLCVLAERRLRAGLPSDLGTLVHDLEEPPIAEVGVLEVDAFVCARDRIELAAALNAILAAPSFEAWREGASLDVASWMTRDGAKTPLTIVSVAHLDEAERELVLGVVLEEIAGWMRTQSGSGDLRGLVVFDEVYGYLPPHPASPATKKPLVTLMKQARAFGVGVVIATQNPMDLDYRALGNAGLWCIGRLQTDADRERVIDGLATSTGFGDLLLPDAREAKKAAKRERTRERSDRAYLADIVRRLPPRWFLVRDVHDEGARGSGGMRLVQSRQTMSLLRGPMTKVEIAKALRRDRALRTD